jgi:hypothetical protein
MILNFVSQIYIKQHKQTKRDLFFKNDIEVQLHKISSCNSLGYMEMEHILGELKAYFAKTLKSRPPSLQDLRTIIATLLSSLTVVEELP